MTLQIKALEILIKNLEKNKKDFIEKCCKSGNRFPKVNQNLVDNYNKQITKYQLALDKLRMQSK